MTVQEEREERRLLVATLLIRLKSPSRRRVHAAIIRNERFATVSEATIGRDMKAIRATHLDALSAQAPELYIKAVTEIEEVHDELWVQHRHAMLPPCPECKRGPREGLALAILNTLISLHDRRVRLGQTLGIIAKAPEKVEVGLGREMLDTIFQALVNRVSADAQLEIARALRSLDVEQPKLLESLGTG